MNAFVRVARAPGLVVLVVVFHLALAGVAGQVLTQGTRVGMNGYAVPDDGQLLGKIPPFITDHLTLGIAFGMVAAVAVVLGLFVWTLLVGGVIHRLHAPAPASEVAAVAVRFFPGILVVGVWHLLARILLLAALVAVSRPFAAAVPGLGAILVLIGLFFCSHALDLARCHVVLDAAPRFQAMTALKAFVQAFRKPWALLAALGLGLAQWATVAGTLALAVAGLGTGYAIWVTRLLAVIGVVLGLVRIAVAVGAGGDRTEPEPAVVPSSADSEADPLAEEAPEDEAPEDDLPTAEAAADESAENLQPAES